MKLEEPREVKIQFYHVPHRGRENFSIDNPREIVAKFELLS